jgi:hypothetical protein
VAAFQPNVPLPDVLAGRLLGGLISIPVANNDAEAWTGPLTVTLSSDTVPLKAASSGADGDGLLVVPRVRLVGAGDQVRGLMFALNYCLP